MTRILIHAPVGNSAKILILLAEKQLDLPVEKVTVPVDAVLAEVHLASPSASLPVLIEEDGSAIAESSVICEYLNERYSDTPLMSSDVVGRWRTRSWFKFVNEDLAPATAILAWQAWTLQSLKESASIALATRLAHLPVERRLFWEEALAGFSAARIDQARSKIAMVAGLIEQALADSPYLAGELFSLADIDVWPFASVLPRLVPDIVNADATPRLMAWIERVGERPAVRRATADAQDTDWVPGPEPIRWG
ncbi:glutathione S-transferase family protein [Altererythrobacter sp.]|uniref:glutathione S-transferase family protein n=1 Tax=Altererythrobacter sp. TaxID=1872480 RepID=UPI003D06848C